MTTGTDMDDGSPEITLEDFDRFLKELLPKYEDTLAGRLAYVHAVLSFGLENPAPVEYLARCVIKERIALRIALTARDDALVSIRVLVQDCGVESAFRKWLYTPEAHVAKCKHGSNPDLCIACAYEKIESGECEVMSDRTTDPVSLPMDVKRKLLAARDALAVGDLMEAHHQIYSIASPNFDKLADEVWTALETPTPALSGGASEPPTNSVSVSSLLVGGAPEPSETLYTAKDVEALFAIRDAAVAAHTAKPVATAWMNGGVMENAFPRAPRTPEEWAQHDSDGYWSAKGYSELPLYFGPPSPPEPAAELATVTQSFRWEYDQRKRVEAVLREAADYLSSNPLNNIGSGSQLHRQMIASLPSSPETK